MGFAGKLIRRPLKRVIRLLRKKAMWPMVKAGGRAAGMPAEMLVHFLYSTTYDTSNTVNDLKASGISCPRVSDYLPVLIDYFEKNMSGR
jgi:hypothetical protein